MGFAWSLPDHFVRRTLAPVVTFYVAKYGAPFAAADLHGAVGNKGRAEVGVGNEPARQDIFPEQEIGEQMGRGERIEGGETGAGGTDRVDGATRERQTQR